MGFTVCQICTKRYYSQSSSTEYCPKCRQVVAESLKVNDERNSNGGSKTDTETSKEDHQKQVGKQEEIIEIDEEDDCLQDMSKANKISDIKAVITHASSESSRCNEVSLRQDTTLEVAVTNEPTENSVSSNNHKNTDSMKNNDRNLKSIDYTCFVCGCSLVHLKSVSARVNHIKRCSKKHSHKATTSGDDMLENGDVNHDGDVNMFPNKSDNQKGNGDGFTQSAERAFTSTNLKSCSKSSILNFVQQPVKSINELLMNNAKRQALSKNSNNSKSNTNQISRGSSSNGFKRRKFDNTRVPEYKVVSGTNFLVDGFYYANAKYNHIYFLTHFHSDHYGGLTKSWNLGKIYCSVPTARLVNHQLGIANQYIEPCEINQPFVVVSNLNGQSCQIRVTLLDANHCPGAVMFLFEYLDSKSTTRVKKTVLHVGDFRWNQTVMSRNTIIRQFSSTTSKRQLDQLYLDTTYCNPKHVFPTQDEVIEAAICIIKRELDGYEPSNNSTNKKLFLFGSYTIGKERIYMAVAEHFDWKIYVDPRRFKILSMLNWKHDQMQRLTTDKSQACLWVVPLGHIDFIKMKKYLSEACSNNKVFTKAVKYTHVVGFRPTGWSYNGKSREVIGKRSNGSINIYNAPYSEHSSFSELVDCVRSLQPKKIVPTVSVSKSAEQCRILYNAVNDTSKQTKLPFSPSPTKKR